MLQTTGWRPYEIEIGKLMVDNVNSCNRTKELMEKALKQDDQELYNHLKVVWRTKKLMTRNLFLTMKKCGFLDDDELKTGKVKEKLFV